MGFVPLFVGSPSLVHLFGTLDEAKTIANRIIASLTQTDTVPEFATINFLLPDLTFTTVPIEDGCTFYYHGTLFDAVNLPDSEIASGVCVAVTPDGAPSLPITRFPIDVLWVSSSDVTGRTEPEKLLDAGDYSVLRELERMFLSGTELNTTREALRKAAKELRTGSTYFDADGEPQEKQDYTLDALPLPCTITIEGIQYAVTEQPTFEFNYPGTYEIKVDAGPAYLKKVFKYDYQP